MALLTASSADLYSITDAQFLGLRDLMYRETGVSLSDAKRQLVCSRLARRLRALGLSSYADYIDYLEESDPKGSEFQEMVNCLTTNKTDFFREPHHFEFLRDVVLPELQTRSNRSGKRSLRIWSSACSEGDEPYSIAMTVLEHLPGAKAWDIQIVASDVNTDVLHFAQRGIYPMEKIPDVEGTWMQKYLLRGKHEHAGKFQVRPDVRQLVSFQQVNLMKPWQFREPFDVIFCRNVIIYFDQATQKQLLERMAGQVSERGYLMLGHSENPPWMNQWYESLGKTTYRRQVAGKRTPSSSTDDKSLAPQRVSVQQPQQRRTNAGKRDTSAAAQTRQAIARQNVDLPKHNVIAGQTLVLDKPGVISTILGSCVAVCLYDPESHVGGMNHFMLPAKSDDTSACARYGIHAMELLITGIMKHGGRRDRLQAKAFGGADVLRMNSDFWKIGQKNIEFIQEFLEMEDFPLVGQKLGGQKPLRIHFQPHTGRVFVETIERSQEFARRELEVESRTRKDVKKTGEVTLFS